VSSRNAPDLLVDPEDAHVLAEHHWMWDGNYWRAHDKGRTLLLHRVIMGCTRGDGVFVDHENRNTSDNRRTNLRLTNKRASPQNVGADRGSTSRYRGVSWCAQTRRWKAQVRMGGTTRNLGRFDTEEEAFAVAQAARLASMPFAVD
jgi:hypothetical protein